VTLFVRVAYPARARNSSSRSSIVPVEPALEEAGDMARDYIASLPSDSFPNMVQLADHFAVTDNDQRFELLLDLFVDGLAARTGA